MFLKLICPKVYIILDVLISFIKSAVKKEIRIFYVPIVVPKFRSLPSRLGVIIVGRLYRLWQAIVEQTCLNLSSTASYYDLSTGLGINSESTEPSSVKQSNVPRVEVYPVYFLFVALLIKQSWSSLSMFIWC